MAYSGQHYDALVSAVRGTAVDEVDDTTCLREFPDNFGMTTKETATAAGNKFATEQREKSKTELLSRVRKRIKCGGCGEVLLDARAFEAHCKGVEHEDDFAYDCEEIEVQETVPSVDAD